MIMLPPLYKELPGRIQRMMWSRPRDVLLADLHLLKQPFRTLPGEAEPGGPFGQKRPREPGLSSLLTRAATPEDLEAIRLTCLKKEIELEPILEKWQVSRLEELDGASAQQVVEWLESQ